MFWCEAPILCDVIARPVGISTYQVPYLHGCIILAWRTGTNPNNIFNPKKCCNEMAPNANGQAIPSISLGLASAVPGLPMHAKHLRIPMDICYPKERWDPKGQNIGMSSTGTEPIRIAKLQ